MSADIFLVYDRQCPMCEYYCTLSRVRESAGRLVLVDARDGGPLMGEITAAGLDIDDGMVLKVGDRLYYGADAARHPQRRFQPCRVLDVPVAARRARAVPGAARRPQPGAEAARPDAHQQSGPARPGPLLMKALALVALGGALGSVARYLLSGWVLQLAPAASPATRQPTTLTVNVPHGKRAAGASCRTQPDSR